MLKNSQKKKYPINKADANILPLDVSQLRKLIDYYEKNYNIKIYINGDSLNKLNILAKQAKQLTESDKKWYESWQCSVFIASYYHPDLQINPINFVMPHVIRNIVQESGLDGIENCKLLKTEKTTIQSILDKYLFSDKNQNIRSMTLDEIEKLDEQLTLHLLISDSEALQQKFKTFMLAYQSTMEALLAEKPYLTKLQINHEIKCIQAALTSDKIVGYIFNDKVLTEQEGHIEPLIITKNAVIKPIHWHTIAATKGITPGDLQGLYTSDWLTGQAQSSPIGCRTLSLLYLKELLKNNAEQFIQYSRFCQIYSNITNILKPPTLYGFYLPSPQVLRYSQSNLYNEMVVASMQDTDIATFSHAGKTEEIVTIKKRLLDSMEVALKRKDTATFNENKKLFDKLPAFRELWLKQYAIVTEKRNAFNHEKTVNTYLSTRSKKFHMIFAELVSQTEKVTNNTSATDQIDSMESKPTV